MGDTADVVKSTVTEAATKLCGACSEERPKASFSRKQWMCRQQRRCKDCTEAGREIMVQKKKPGKTKNKPARAADHKGVHERSTPGAEFNAKINGHFCSWCGKAEETEEMKLCMRCHNIEYCSEACQKAGWKEHKLVCEELKQDRKRSTKQQRKQPAGISSYSEASGVGSFAFHTIPEVNLFILSTQGELRGNEEPGVFFASDAAKENIRNFFGEHRFALFCQSMVQESLQERKPFGRKEYFSNVKELQPTDQFLLSCGPWNDLEHAKAILPLVLHQIRISGRKPDGTIPDITDITVRGYQLNALEWAARRGNYEIAEWLATDPRTKIMVTRPDSAPVAWACYTNKVEIAKMLVENGADSHATTTVVYGHKPPTHLAAENGQLLAVKYLVETCNHDIHERDELGMNIRTCIRQNCSNWSSLAGSVAVDNYAKSKGVREYS